MDSPITNLIERGLTSFWRVLKVSYIEKNDLYRLHFGYKSCFSFTNVAFRVQKLRFAYKYLIVNLQNCISNYKVASRNAIQPLKSRPKITPKICLIFVTNTEIIRLEYKEDSCACEDFCIEILKD